MTQWVDLAGKDNVTNYIHMVGAMHMVYFLRKYGSLYKYSQQGWENLNKKIKHYYFHNTNHGGCVGVGEEATKGDHVKPLILMLQRSHLWHLGIGDAYFQGEDQFAEEEKKFEKMVDSLLENKSDIEDDEDPAMNDNEENETAADEGDNDLLLFENTGNNDL